MEADTRRADDGKVRTRPGSLPGSSASDPTYLSATKKDVDQFHDILLNCDTNSWTVLGAGRWCAVQRQEAREWHAIRGCQERDDALSA